MDAATSKKIARRRITNADRQAADNLRRIYHAYRRQHPHVTQQTIANEFGWQTQGAVSHYMTGKIAMNTEVVLRFAQFFGIDPTAIRPDFKYSKKVHIRHRTEPPNPVAALSLEAIALARKWMALDKATRTCLRDTVAFRYDALIKVRAAAIKRKRNQR